MFVTAYYHYNPLHIGFFELLAGLWLQNYNG